MDVKVSIVVDNLVVTLAKENHGLTNLLEDVWVFPPDGKGVRAFINAEFPPDWIWHTEELPILLAVYMC